MSPLVFGKVFRWWVGWNLKRKRTIIKPLQNTRQFNSNLDHSTEIDSIRTAITWNSIIIKSRFLVQLVKVSVFERTGKPKSFLSIKFNFVKIIAHAFRQFFPSLFKRCLFVNKTDGIWFVILSNCKAFGNFTQTCVLFKSRANLRRTNDWPAGKDGEPAEPGPAECRPPDFESFDPRQVDDQHEPADHHLAFQQTDSRPWEAESKEEDQWVDATADVPDVICAERICWAFGWVVSKIGHCRPADRPAFKSDQNENRRPADCDHGRLGMFDEQWDQMQTGDQEQTNHRPIDGPPGHRAERCDRQIDGRCEWKQRWTSSKEAKG